MDTKAMKFNLTKQELKLIQLKLRGLTIEEISHHSQLKEYEVRDVLKRKHVKAELAVAYDELGDIAQEMLKAKGINATQNLIDAMTNPNFTGTNIKAIELILRQIGVLNPPKTINENLNQNINADVDISEETARKIKDLWDELNP